MILAKLKGYAAAIGALVALALGVLARILFLKSQRDRFRSSAEKHKARAEQADRLAKARVQNANERSERRDKSKREIAESGHSEHLANPNDGWLRRDRDT